MSDIQVMPSLVNANWLKENWNASNLVILDATLPKAVAGGNADELPNEQIKGARFFDIKNEFSELGASYPNTWPGEAAFNFAAKKLGINNDSAIVVYDDHGIYSCARAWWMFRAMGHKNVAVLDGGLPVWKGAAGYVETKKDASWESGNFKGSYSKDFLYNHNEVLKRLGDNNSHILDARAKDRYLGLAEEPRKGLRSGHIPGSLSLPYTNLLNHGKMKSEEELKEVFARFGQEDKNLIFSCGSGITACVLALGAELSGLSKLAVYDGSWTEWGSMEELPIEKG